MITAGSTPRICPGPATPWTRPVVRAITPWARQTHSLPQTVRLHSTRVRSPPPGPCSAVSPPLSLLDQNRASSAPKSAQNDRYYRQNSGFNDLPMRLRICRSGSGPRTWFGRRSSGRLGSRVHARPGGPSPAIRRANAGASGACNT